MAPRQHQHQHRTGWWEGVRSRIARLRYRLAWVVLPVDQWEVILLLDEAATAGRELARPDPADSHQRAYQQGEQKRLEMVLWILAYRLGVDDRRQVLGAERSEDEDEGDPLARGTDADTGEEEEDDTHAD